MQRTSPLRISDRNRNYPYHVGRALCSAQAGNAVALPSFGHAQPRSTTGLTSEVWCSRAHVQCSEVGEAEASRRCRSLRERIASPLSRVNTSATAGEGRVVAIRRADVWCDARQAESAQTPNNKAKGTPADPSHRIRIKTILSARLIIIVCSLGWLRCKSCPPRERLTVTCAGGPRDNRC